MTSQLNVDTIVDKAGSGGTNVKIGNTSTYVSDGGNVTQNTVQGIAKAWVQGTGAAALSDSFNISSGTDNGTGNYTYTLSNDMNNNQWSQTCNALSAEIAQVKNTTLLTSSISLTVFKRNDTFTAADQRNFITLHGDLA